MTRVIISGGGTGGHVFPAIAIARAIRDLAPGTDILFVGALGKMEMEKVPAAGFRIEGLPVVGFQRRLTWKNLLFPLRLWMSLQKAGKIISDYKPDVVIGVGGYASGPVLRIATAKGIPSLIQEQNSFPGVTNRILSRKVSKICVAYPGMDTYFPQDKIIMTGNPVRKDLVNPGISPHEAQSFFGLVPGIKTVLAIGGSLGAKTINEAVGRIVDLLEKSQEKYQVLWQTGKFYYPEIKERFDRPGAPAVIQPFIDRMDMAYAAADVIISRAGAIAISELCIVGKPVILVPSPNVAEDHQTKNGKALESRNAAIMVGDKEAVELLPGILENMLANDKKLQSLAANISFMAIPDAAQKIAKEALDLAGIHDVKTDESKTTPVFPGVVYFLGIGGIGMSALARYFHAGGSAVSGYDKTPTTLTAQMQNEGISLHFEEDISKIPENPDLVVYTPAIPANHKEYSYLTGKGFNVQKRAVVLGSVSRNYQTIAIAGTHGKTTTTSMVTHILCTAGIPHLAFLGGISKNYGTNYINEPGKSAAGIKYCVVEADEFDRSFLQLEPSFAVITSTDADHLDIYGHHNEMIQTFQSFISRIRPGGNLFLKSGIGINPEPSSDYQTFQYHSSEKCHYYADNVRIQEGTSRFDFIYPGGTLNQVTLGVPGKFNLENAVAALAIGTKMGIDPDSLRKAVESYRGVKRRFEFVVKTSNHVYIDDYAHHPEELKACISAARELYPQKRLTGIFQPHLFSRTRDLADGFAESLSLLDDLILLEIYPARELPIEGITSRWLLNKINLESKRCITRDGLIPEISQLRPEVLLTMGAGDIDQFVTPLESLIKQWEE